MDERNDGENFAPIETKMFVDPASGLVYAVAYTTDDYKRVPAGRVLATSRGFTEEELEDMDIDSIETVVGGVDTAHIADVFETLRTW